MTLLMFLTCLASVAGIVISVAMFCHAFMKIFELLQHRELHVYYHYIHSNSDNNSDEDEEMVQNEGEEFIGGITPSQLWSRLE